jgi:hypothetical protein
MMGSISASTTGPAACCDEQVRCHGGIRVFSVRSRQSASSDFFNLDVCCPGSETIDGSRVRRSTSGLNGSRFSLSTANEGHVGDPTRGDRSIAAVPMSVQLRPCGASSIDRDGSSPVEQQAFRLPRTGQARGPGFAIA